MVSKNLKLTNLQLGDLRVHSSDANFISNVYGFLCVIKNSKHRRCV